MWSEMKTHLKSGETLATGMSSVSRTSRLLGARNLGTSDCQSFASTADHAMGEGINLGSPGR